MRAIRKAKCQRRVAIDHASVGFVDPHLDFGTECASNSVTHTELRPKNGDLPVWVLDCSGSLAFVRGGSAIGRARALACGGSVPRRQAQQKANGDKNPIGKSFACPNKLFHHVSSAELEEQRSDRFKKSALRFSSGSKMSSSVLAQK